MAESGRRSLERSASSTALFAVPVVRGRRRALAGGHHRLPARRPPLHRRAGPGRGSTRVRRGDRIANSAPLARFAGAASSDNQGACTQRSIIADQPGTGSGPETPVEVSPQCRRDARSCLRASSGRTRSQIPSSNRIRLQSSADDWGRSRGGSTRIPPSSRSV